MRELNFLKDYPQPMARPLLPRGIANRLVACEREREFFDGARVNGHGGLRYDGRWKPVAEFLCKQYRLNGKSWVLQTDCEKGFLLHEFKKLHPTIKVIGQEDSAWARKCSMLPRISLVSDSFLDHKWEPKKFNLAIAIGSVYTKNLHDSVSYMRELKRISVRQFITLAAYETDADLKLFRAWSLLATTVLTKAEWREVMHYAGYEGDYHFVTAASLRLTR